MQNSARFEEKGKESFCHFRDCDVNFKSQIKSGMSSMTINFNADISIYR
jgi:hypothetical protein